MRPDQTVPRGTTDEYEAAIAAVIEVMRAQQGRDNGCAQVIPTSDLPESRQVYWRTRAAELVDAARNPFVNHPNGHSTPVAR
jgi:hypothetical protein